MRNLHLIGIYLLCILPQIGLANAGPENISQLIRDFKSGESIINKSVILEEVNFAEEKSNLDITARNSLEEIAILIKKIPTVVVEVVSHTDKKSEKKVGRQLTRIRAKNVSDFLILKGLSYQQVFYTGVGDQEPIASNKSDAGRAKNNRIELRFISLKKGKHQIITTDNQRIIASTIIIDNDILYYRQEEKGGNQSLALKEVQKVELAFGKNIVFNSPEELMNTNLAETDPVMIPEKKQKKEDTPLIEKQKKTKRTASTVNPIQQPEGKKSGLPSATTPKLSSMSTPKKEKVKSKDTTNLNPQTDKASVVKKETKVASSEVKKQSIKPKTDKPVIVATTTKKNKVSTPSSVETRPTKIVNPSELMKEDARTSQQSSSSKITSRQIATAEVATSTSRKEPTTQTIKERPNTPTKKLKTTTNTTTTNSTIAALSEQDALSFYLDNYILTPKAKSKHAPTSEQLLSKMNGFNASIGDLRGGVNGIVEENILEEEGGRTTVAGSKGGITFQLVRQPLMAVSTPIGFNYVDDSSDPSRVNINKNLPVNDNALLGSLGLIYHADNQLSYQMNFTFGGKDTYRYNAVNVGGSYRIQKGKLTLLPSAFVEYGKAKIFLEEHRLITDIFTVKKRKFIGESVSIDYLETMVSVSPQLGISFPIKGAIDLLLHGGYNVGLNLGSKIKFTGSTDGDNQKSSKKKLSIGDFRVNGETVTKRAQLIDMQGLVIKAGVIYRIN